MKKRLGDKLTKTFGRKRKAVIKFVALTVLLVYFLPEKINAKSVISLQYDDVYTFSTKYKVISVKNEKISSYIVKKGRVSKQKDRNILCKKTGNKYVASGIGTATVNLKNKVTQKKKSIKVIVKPATLTLMYLMGQSNMSGSCSASTGCRTDQSVKCKNGTVYSTYTRNRTDIAPYPGLINANVKNAQSIVAESLTSKKSIAGNNLRYPLDALTASGLGKTGPDSALAYEWNRLTKDKVWIVNSAVPASSINEWVENGEHSKAAVYIGDNVKMIYDAEIRAGHYRRGNILCFWLQGEQDRLMSYSEYNSKFNRMYRNLKSGLKFEKFGIIGVRATMGDRRTEQERNLVAPRLTQYSLAANKNVPNIYMVSDVNFGWMSDLQVKNYFRREYPSGKFTQPLRSNVPLPSSVREIHDDIHYTQIGHNENGITAARGMFAVVKNKKNNTVSGNFLDEKGNFVKQLTLNKNSVVPVIFKVNPCYSSKEVIIRGERGVRYKNGMLYIGKTAGTSFLTAWYKGKRIGQLLINIR